MRVHQDRNTFEDRRNLLQKRQPFTDYRRFIERNPVMLPPGWAKLAA
jgi:hypothetical protein